MSAVDFSAITDIITHAEQNAGVIGAAILFPSGERFGHNADRRFVAASTVKIPIMIELFHQIDSGKRSLSETYTLQDKDRAQGSGVMLHLHAGMEFTIRDLVYLMISISDNMATNVLIDIVGMPQVNATMRHLEMHRSCLGRKMRGRARLNDEQENWATPNDYATAIAALLNHTAASPESCRQMIDMLEKQQNGRRIARHLPAENGPRWGSKTGSLSGVINDVGFIETDHGPLILSIYCEHADPHRGEAIIGEISRAAMQVASSAMKHKAAP